MSAPGTAGGDPRDGGPLADGPLPDGPDEVVRYHEFARGFRSLVWTIGVLCVGFAIDALLGLHGAITHLPGWLVFGGVLVGIQLLLLHGVRLTHSLSVTDGAVRVGEETLPRDGIAGLGDEADVRNVVDPTVLGWPDGRPRFTRTVVLRLTDGRDIEVPTRFPARLLAALDLAEAGARPAAQVRDATADDLPVLAEIDRRADTVFRVAGYALPELPFDAAAAALFVVGTPPVGFAQVDVVDGTAHLTELAVLPANMRRGLGTQLLEAACGWAREQGHPAITLTTFADVPWNGPFYARHGFVELRDPGPGLRAVRARETGMGLDAVARRIAMRRAL